MPLTEDGFLYQIKQLVTGVNASATPGTGTASAADGGFRVDRQIPVQDFGLLGGSNAIVTAETHAFALKVAAGTSAVGTIAFAVPRDYDEASDHLILRVEAEQLSIATDNNVALQAVVYTKVAGAALSSASAIQYASLPFPSVVPTAASAQRLTTLLQVLEINLSGLGLKRDNIAFIALATNGNNATATNEVEIYAAETSYDSCLVSYNETDNLGVDGALSAEGNPLR
jgi:hypothetical protein